MYIVCMCVCVCETKRQSGRWHVSLVLSDEVLVEKGSKEVGMQLGEEGAVGLPRSPGKLWHRGRGWELVERWRAG